MIAASCAGGWPAWRRVQAAVGHLHAAAAAAQRVSAACRPRRGRALRDTMAGAHGHGAQPALRPHAAPARAGGYSDCTPRHGRAGRLQQRGGGDVLPAQHRPAVRRCTPVSRAHATLRVCFASTLKPCCRALVALVDTPPVRKSTHAAAMRMRTLRCLAEVPDGGCRNVKLALQTGESWRPMVVPLHSSRGRVRMELDQPVTACGERLCCGCRGKVAAAPAVDVSAEAAEAPVLSTMLMLFCSTRCAARRVRVVSGRRTAQLRDLLRAEAAHALQVPEPVHAPQELRRHPPPALRHREGRLRRVPPRHGAPAAARARPARRGEAGGHLRGRARVARQQADAGRRRAPRAPHDRGSATHSGLPGVFVGHEQRRPWGTSSGVGHEHRRACAGNAWQADHIRAVHLGGGLCDITNFRTLCTVCHAKVTKRQAAERAGRRAAASPAKASPAKASPRGAAKRKGGGGCATAAAAALPSRPAQEVLPEGRRRKRRLLRVRGEQLAARHDEDDGGEREAALDGE